MASPNSTPIGLPSITASPMACLPVTGSCLTRKLRGETFVTRKITRAVAAIELGLQRELYIDNLDAQRDWGDARDFVKGMWLILQQAKPDDYVLATGESHSVREFIELAFAQVGRKLAWRGKGDDEVGLDAASGQVLIKVDR